MKCSERNLNSLFNRRLLLQTLVFPCATLVPAFYPPFVSTAWATEPIQHSLYLQTVVIEGQRDRAATSQSVDKSPRRLPKPTVTRQTSGELVASQIGTPVATEQRSERQAADWYAKNPNLSLYFPNAEPVSGKRDNSIETEFTADLATKHSATGASPAMSSADNEPRTPIERAARRLAEIRDAEANDAPPKNRGNWLQSVTAESCAQRSEQQLDDAFREYRVGAWASAESSAWKALNLIATGIDVTNRQASGSSDSTALSSATQDLHAARVAVDEGREFMAGGASGDVDRLAAIAASHQTPVFQHHLSANESLPAGLTATDATDRYFDYARTKLARLAESHVTAAKALDLLAAIELGRDDQSRLPEETSLCFRRAALQGQPKNGSLATRLGMQLADMGLDREAAFTLQHALNLGGLNLDGQRHPEAAATLAEVAERLGDRETALRLTETLRQQNPQPALAPRKPEIVELSPDQFAAISPPMNVMKPSGGIGDNSVPAQTASARQANRSQPADFATYRIPASNQPVAIPSAHAITPNQLPHNTTTAPGQVAVPQSAASPVKRLMNKLRFW